MSKASKKAAAAIAKRKGRFLDPAYSRYDEKTGVLTDPDGTTVFSENGPVRRTLRRLTGREEEKKHRDSLKRGGGR